MMINLFNSEDTDSATNFHFIKKLQVNNNNIMLC